MRKNNGSAHVVVVVTVTMMMLLMLSCCCCCCGNGSGSGVDWESFFNELESELESELQTIDNPTTVSGNNSNSGSGSNEDIRTALYDEGFSDDQIDYAIIGIE